MSVTEVNDRVFEFVGENASRFLELRTASVSLNKKFSAGITLFTWKLNVFQTWSTVVAWWKVKRQERWWCGQEEMREQLRQVGNFRGQTECPRCLQILQQGYCYLCSRAIGEFEQRRG
jgi:hypothetical protein